MMATSGCSHAVRRIARLDSKEVDAQVTFTRDASGAATGLVLHQDGRDRPAKIAQ